MSKVDLRHYGRPTHPAITRDYTGVWLDGAFGWHNTYRVIDAAVARGFKLDENDSDALELYRRDETPPNGTTYDYVNIVHDLSADATEYLQSLVTEDDLYFVWDAGELSLQEVEDDS